jgi:hypothetical protein
VSSVVAWFSRRSPAVSAVQMPRPVQELIKSRFRAEIFYHVTAQTSHLNDNFYSNADLLHCVGIFQTFFFSPFIMPFQPGSFDRTLGDAPVIQVTLIFTTLFF